jgi:hypothetical protein
MSRRFALSILGILGMGLPASGASQVFSFTPTYQASFQEWDTRFVNSSFESWGIMVGVDAGRSWRWPHVWAQRYLLGSICPESQPGREDCRIKGWMVSLGPKIQFAKTSWVAGSLVPTVGFDSGSRREFTGGAGLHVDVEAGGFRPQFFGRFQMVRGQAYSTVGFGITFNFGEPRAAREPGWGRQ